MNKSLCISTYVFGEYVQYIPAFIFFAKQANPACHPFIFINGKLDTNTQQALSYLGKKYDFTICEKYLPNFKQGNQYGKAIRWLLWDDAFLQYDGVYIGDIDIFIMKEAMTITDSHLIHCDTLGIPFSNIIRPLVGYPFKFKPKMLYQGMKRPLDTIKLLIKKKIYPLRLSGLHFFKPHEYATRYLPLRDRFLHIIKKQISYPWHLFGFHNESFLFDMMVACGWIDEDFINKMLESGFLRYGHLSPEEFAYRPHHGLHIGLFRETKNMGKCLSSFSSNGRDLLRLDEYQRYYQQYIALTHENEVYSEIKKYFPARLHAELAYMDYAFSCIEMENSLQ